MAKLEKPQALARLDEIMEVSDALMVARGDLGEMPSRRCPACKSGSCAAPGVGKAGRGGDADARIHGERAGADQGRGFRCGDGGATRGADAVMLSAESASGLYPIEAVSTMSRIAEECERDSIYWSIITSQRTEPEATGSDAIAAGAHQIADTLGLKAMAAWTFSGSTAFGSPAGGPIRP